MKVQSRKMYRLTSHKSKARLENKLRMKRVITKPIWTYGVQLPGTPVNGYIAKMEAFRVKSTIDAPWYLRNEDIRKALKTSCVPEGIAKYTKRYRKEPLFKNRKTSQSANKKSWWQTKQKTAKETTSFGLNRIVKHSQERKISNVIRARIEKKNFISKLALLIRQSYEMDRHCRASRGR